jgi:poly(hydroxyalkanoate) depolymerase family esterase
MYGSMKAWECVPSGMEGKTATPAGLVVALHGYTQGVQQASGGKTWGFKPTTEWAKLAERHRFYVIFPDHGTSAFQWYAFFGTTGIGRTDLEPSGIAQMVKDTQAKYNIDPQKIFVNGLSAGAYMAVVMLATYPDLFSAGSTFAGGAYGCSTSCAALGKKGQGWTWPGNHAATLVKNAYPTVWNSASARKPRLMIFQGDADGAVTPENLADLTQQWSGAVGVAGAGAKSQLKGHDYTEYSAGGRVMVASVLMKGIGHGTPVDPGGGPDQGGWDPEPSKTMTNDAAATQDWTNSAGIYGPYYSAKFFGLVP